MVLGCVNFGLQPLVTIVHPSSLSFSVFSDPPHRHLSSTGHPPNSALNFDLGLKSTSNLTQIERGRHPFSLLFKKHLSWEVFGWGRVRPSFLQCGQPSFFFRFLPLSSFPFLLVVFSFLVLPLHHVLVWRLLRSIHHLCPRKHPKRILCSRHHHCCCIFPCR